MQYVPVPIYTPGKLVQVSCLRKQHVGKVQTIYCCWFAPVPADPKFEKQHQREANDLQCIFSFFFGTVTLVLKFIVQCNVISNVFVMYCNAILCNAM